MELGIWVRVSSQVSIRSWVVQGLVVVSRLELGRLFEDQILNQGLGNVHVLAQPRDQVDWLSFKSG